MAIVGIYKLASSNTKLGLSKEEMANNALPFLIPLSIETGLTVQQFNIIVNLVKDMVQKVETEQRTKLEQLNANQDTQKTSLQMSLSENMALTSNKLVAAQDAADMSAVEQQLRDQLSVDLRPRLEQTEPTGTKTKGKKVVNQGDPCYDYFGNKEYKVRLLLQ